MKCTLSTELCVYENGYKDYIQKKYVAVQSWYAGVVSKGDTIQLMDNGRAYIGIYDIGSRLTTYTKSTYGIITNDTMVD